MTTPDIEYHYILTIKATTSTGDSATYTQDGIAHLTPGHTRSLVMWKIYDKIRDDHGITVDTPVVILFFSLEPNALPIPDQGAQE